MEVVWLSDRPVDNANAFVLVLQEGTPRSIPNASPQSLWGRLATLDSLYRPLRL